jgi:hypothetical protein
MGLQNLITYFYPDHWRTNDLAVEVRLLGKRVGYIRQERLRDFKDEIENLEDVARRAVDALECAIETLSEQV